MPTLLAIAVDYYVFCKMQATCTLYSADDLLVCCLVVLAIYILVIISIFIETVNFHGVYSYLPEKDLLYVLLPVCNQLAL